MIHRVVCMNLIAISYVFLYNIYKEQSQVGEEAVARLIQADVSLPILYIQNICRIVATGKIGRKRQTMTRRRCSYAWYSKS